MSCSANDAEMAHYINTKYVWVERTKMNIWAHEPNILQEDPDNLTLRSSIEFATNLWIINETPLEAHPT